MLSFILGHTDTIHWWNIADFIVAIAFVYILVWGRSNKLFKKNEFNEGFLSLDTMKSLRGFAAIGVILHHISQEPVFQQEGILSPFVNAGAYFVAIFFFASGYGLLKSFDSKPGYLKGFIKKRIVKSIIIPYYVDILIYGALIALVRLPMDNEQWVFNLLGVTMMNQFAWFPIVLAILYLLFFVTFRLFSNRKTCFKIIFAFIILMGIGTMIEGHYAWWTGPDNWWCSEYYYMNEATWWMKEKVFWFHGEWWVNSAPAFLTGLVFANYEKKIVDFFKENYWKRFFILVIITEVCFAISDIGQSKFGYWTEFNLKGPEIGNKIATYFCQLPLFLILPVTIFIFLMKYHVSNPISRFFGKYSLHTYLMNLAAIMLLRFLQYNDEGSPFYMGDRYNNLFAFAIGVILLTVALGVCEYKITSWVQEKIFGSPKPAAEPATRVSLLDNEDDAFARKMSMFRKEELGLAKAEAVSDYETVEETSLREKPKKKNKKSKK
ncbi:MAG: acyltransferase [Clostridiales bacterium]|nr:acyltransferase [Clostridiales bacterium]